MEKFTALYRTLRLIEDNPDSLELSLVPANSYDFLIDNGLVVKNNMFTKLTRAGKEMVRKLTGYKETDVYGYKNKPSLESVISNINVDLLLSRDVRYTASLYTTTIGNRQHMAFLRHVFNSGGLDNIPDALNERAKASLDTLLLINAINVEHGRYVCSRFGEDLLYINSLL